MRHTGELQDVAREYWGKGLIKWHKSPEHALHTALSLQRKYCIDGADAVKHAGVLWCFGLFGIPQQPKRPVFGVLRTQQQYNEEERQATVRLLNGSSWGQAHVG